MAKVTIMWWALLALPLMLSLSAWGQTVHYNQELLNTYGRLGQQLRRQMARESMQMSGALTQKEEVRANAQARVQAAIIDAYNVMQTVQDRLDTFLATAEIYTASALAAVASNPFDDDDEPIFNDVKLDHGMDYSSTEGRIVITQSGLYMMEFKNQGRDFMGVVLKMDVQRPNGALRYSFFWYTDWEISPYFEPLSMETGDVLIIKSYRESGNSMHRGSQLLVTGAANIFTLRFLGQTTGDNNVATAPPVEDTTVYWNWGW